LCRATDLERLKNLVRDDTYFFFAFWYACSRIIGLSRELTSHIQSLFSVRELHFPSHIMLNVPPRARDWPGVHAPPNFGGPVSYKAACADVRRILESYGSSRVSGSDARGQRVPTVPRPWGSTEQVWCTAGAPCCTSNLPRNIIPPRQSSWSMVWVSAMLQDSQRTLAFL
jgi:hypothetical protein